MGYKYEVLMWAKDEGAGGCYNDIQFYTGESFFGAMLAMRRAKRISGCVTLKWR